MRRSLILILGTFLAQNALATALPQLIQKIEWAELKMPFISVVKPAKKYYRVTFFDDFKGKPDNSPESNYCYDELKPQCTIWSGYNETTHPCDFSDQPLTSEGSTPPMRVNMKSALYSLAPNTNLEGKSTQEIKGLYADMLKSRWSSVNKCIWESYGQSNNMATDYQGHVSAKMDASQVTVDPNGKGYLILSARKGKVLEHCVFGGALGPLDVLKRQTCALSDDVSAAIKGPLNLYWIDPNKDFPGVFYHKINNGCPYGGSGPVNCQVYAFRPDELSPMVQYALVADQGRPLATYLDSSKYACGDNIQYSPTFGFNALSCPLMNAGILSQNTLDQAGHANGFAQKDGAFEVKLRVPKGLGSFPAAWLMPNQGGWPYSGGEIDILEARDAGDEVYQTYHQGKCINAKTHAEMIDDPGKPGQFIDNGNCQNYPDEVSVNYSTGQTIRQNNGNEFVNRDHVYSVEWTDEKMQWYVNNTAHTTIAPGLTAAQFDVNNPLPGLQSASDISADLKKWSATNMPHSPFFWILDQSTWVAPDKIASWQGQDLFIDYVKVYAECKTSNDFCPSGGQFIEGTGCVAAGMQKVAIYQSPCSPDFPARSCPAGGTVAGPNCQIKGYPKPATPDVLVPGIDYWVDTDPRWPGVYYRTINGQCPVGGSAGVNCQLFPIAGGALPTSVHFWVDADPRWPGIYYQKVRNGCPWGGNTSSNTPNCQWKALKSPPAYLDPKVHYWVDPDPRWAGIYYAKPQEGCIYGGSGSINCQIYAFPADALEAGVQYWVDANPLYPGVYYTPDFR